MNGDATRSAPTAGKKTMNVRMRLINSPQEQSVEVEVDRVDQQEAEEENEDADEDRQAVVLRATRLGVAQRPADPARQPGDPVHRAVDNESVEERRHLGGADD